MSNYRGAGVCARKKQPNYDHPANLSDADRLALARHEFITLLESLAGGDLSAAGYRVVLSTIARLLRQGRTSEAVTTQWIGERLALQRNTIGGAYADLAEAGLVKRIPNPARGAPTRTALAGPALNVVRVLRDVRSLVLPPASLQDDRRAERGPNRATTMGEQQASTMASIEAADESSPLLSGPDSPEAPAQAPDWVAILNEDPEPNEFLKLGMLKMSGGPDRAEDPQPDIRYAPEVHAAVLAKVPGDVLYEAMQTRLMADAIQSAWGLTAEEAACLMSLAPKREARPPRPGEHVKPAVCAVPTTAHPELAKALNERLPLFASKLGEARAQRVLDEVAFMISLKNLGQGDMLRGVRAGSSLVMAGRWSTPRGMTPDWDGAVARALDEAATTVAGDAQKNVR